MSKRIAVLKGGWSPEREVSLVSGGAAGEALRARGYQVEEIDVTPDLAQQLLNSFEAKGPEVVFNALHGQWGEDGCVQGLLEIMQLPYTHSGVFGSAVAMDKEQAKLILAAAGLPVPSGQIMKLADIGPDHPMAPPYVIKPNNQGSSVGVFIIREGDTPPSQKTMRDAYNTDEMLVEQFIPGRELTTAVMGDRALAVTEIIAHTEFYDYEAKYADGGSSHTVPAKIPATIEKACMDMALQAHKALKCAGLSRTDFRYDEARGLDGLYILETNTQPGLTPTSLAPEQADYCGIPFEALVEWMVQDASIGR